MHKFLSLIFILFLSCNPYIDVTLVERDSLKSLDNAIYSASSIDFNVISPLKGEYNFTITSNTNDTSNLKISDFVPTYSGTATCSGFDLTDNNNGSKNLKVYNCSGVGGLVLNHSKFSTDKILLVDGKSEAMVDLRKFVISPDGLFVYVIEMDLASIYKIDISSGKVSTVTSPFKGLNHIGTAARFNGGLAINNAGDTLYIFEDNSNSISAIDISTGDFTLVSQNGGRGVGNSLGDLSDIEINAAEDTLYASDSQNTEILKIDMATGDRTTLSALGIGTGPMFDFAFSSELDETNNRLLVGGNAGDGLYAVDLITGNRQLLFTSSSSPSTQIFGIHSIQYDSLNNNVYIANSNHEILKIDIDAGAREDLSKNIGSLGYIRLHGNEMFLISFEKQRLYKQSVFDLELEPVLVAVGDTGSLEKKLDRSFGVKVSSDDSKIYVVNDTSDYSLIEINANTGKRKIISTTISGSERGTGPNFNSTTGTGLLSSGTSFYTLGNGTMLEVDIATGNRTTMVNGNFGTCASGNILGLSMNNSETFAYFMDRAGDRLQKYDLSDGTCTIESGGGVGAGIAFDEPVGVVVDSSEIYAYIIDFSHDSVMRVDLSNGNRSHLSNSGNGAGPNFELPYKILIDALDTYLYVADNILGQIIRVDLANGNRDVFSGGMFGNGPQLVDISGMSFNSNESYMYLSSAKAEAIYRIDMANGNREILVK